MQRRADTDDGSEYIGQRLLFGAVVQVPALSVMVRQSRIGRSGGHLRVAQACALLRIGRIDDGQPLVDDHPSEHMVVRPLGEAHRHPDIPGSGLDLGARGRPVVGQ